MGEDLRNTAYCGLYCGDCIPSDETLFEAVEKLGKKLSELPLSRYAQVKARQNPVFEDYPTFVGVLDEMRKLRCKAPCREGGGHTECPVRSCAKAKGFLGCWECQKRGACELLAPLKDFHGEVISRNLEVIREYGPDDWSVKRGKHYPWE